MQLILETEPNIDIKKDMAQLNEPLDEKLIITNGVSEEPKTDMFEINLEKLQGPDDVKTAEGSVIEEINIDVNNQEEYNLSTEKETTQCSSVEDVDSNLTRTEDMMVESCLTNNKDEESQEDEEFKSDNSFENADVYKENKIYQESNENDEEPTKKVETKDNTIGNSLTNNKDSGSQREEVILSKNDCINKDVCEENNINQEYNENDDEHAKTCTEKNENYATNKDTEESAVQAVILDIELKKVESKVISDSEEKAENIISINNDMESKEDLLDDFDIDEESNEAVDIDYSKIENELNIDEERNVASDNATSVNEVKSNSINDVVTVKKIDILDSPVENEDSKMDISETSGIAPCADNKSESDYVTAISSVDDHKKKNTVKEALSDESKLPFSVNPEKNLAIDVMETDDTTQISLTEESNKTSAVLGAIDGDNSNLDQDTIDSSNITQMLSNDETKKTAAEVYDKAINIDNNVKDHKNKESDDQTRITIDNNIKDLENVNEESGDIKETPIDKGNNMKDHENEKSDDITQTTIDIYNNINDLEHKNEGFAGTNETPIDKSNNIEDLDHQNKISGEIIQTPIDIDSKIIDLDNENNDSSAITQTPLSDELKMTNANLHDKVDDNKQELNQETMELGEIAQLPLADNSKKTVADLLEKVIDIDDNHVQKETEVTDVVKDTALKKEEQATPAKKKEDVKKPSMVSKLSNTLDILSDDEDEPHKITEKSDSQIKETASDKQCINIEDDDDIMLIDEDTDSKDSRTESCDSVSAKIPTVTSDLDLKRDHNKNENIVTETVELISDNTNKESTHDVTDIIEQPQLNEKTNEQFPKIDTLKPLLPENFLKSAKKNLVDMTRDDLEEFCILKIVESVVDRSNLNEIKTKLKNMTQIVKEYSNKAKMLTKQNRDLQVVMKSIQEEQKKNTDAPIAPLKITRSVGMQVFMTDKVIPRKKGMPGPNTAHANLNTTSKFPKIANPGPRIPRQVQVNNQNQAIPVPRLIPATQNNVTVKTPANQIAPNSNQLKTSSPVTNGVKNAPSAQKSAEKRAHNRIQSVTVDLTDDEPPAKVPTRSSPAVPVRVVPSQSLMPPQRPQLSQSNSNSPRKVYIPISGPQGQNLRPGQYMLKSVSPSSVPRARGPNTQITRMPQNQVRVQRGQTIRHPAPLPDAMKQYQPPNWKSLPPAPDIKLSKVENGIVISWKIDGYLEDVHEEIASYQLYAYQETPSPPSTSLWKKIGDVKALPLPMACTLTQFMAGFKYYFAVRAVDVRSRLGPFGIPGSILLLNKM